MEGIHARIAQATSRRLGHAVTRSSNGNIHKQKRGDLECVVLMQPRTSAVITLEVRSRQCVQQLHGADVGGHDDDCIREINGASFPVRESPSSNTCSSTFRTFGAAFSHSSGV